MTSIFFAIVGYIFAAIVFILDKYILKSRIPSPAMYAFFVGVFSLVALGIAPFGLEFSGWNILALSLLSGVLFVWGLIALYNAIQMSDIMRVAPLVGSMTPAIILIFALCGCIVDQQFYGWRDSIAIFMLILGGIFLSIRIPFQSKIFFRGFQYSVLAAAFLALFSMIFKVASEGQNFISVFTWSRLGMVVGSLTLLLYAPFRQEILSLCCKWGNKGEKKRQWGTVAIFIVSKALGGLGYFLVNLAIVLGSVTIVQALASVQYAFIFIIIWLFLPKGFLGKIDRSFAIQIGVSLFFIGIGIVLVATGEGMGLM